MGPRHQTYLRPRTVQAKPVTTSGTPAPLCTFRSARPLPGHGKRPRPPATRTGRRRRGPSCRIPRQRHAVANGFLLGLAPHRPQARGARCPAPFRSADVPYSARSSWAGCARAASSAGRKASALAAASTPKAIAATGSASTTVSGTTPKFVANTRQAILPAATPSGTPAAIPTSATAVACQLTTAATWYRTNPSTFSKPASARLRVTLTSSRCTIVAAPNSTSIPPNSSGKSTDSPKLTSSAGSSGGATYGRYLLVYRASAAAPAGPGADRASTAYMTPRRALSRQAARPPPGGHWTAVSALMVIAAPLPSPPVPKLGRKDARPTTRNRAVCVAPVTGLGTVTRTVPPGRAPMARIVAAPSMMSRSPRGSRPSTAEMSAGPRTAFIASERTCRPLASISAVVTRVIRVIAGSRRRLVSSAPVRTAPDPVPWLVNSAWNGAPYSAGEVMSRVRLAPNTAVAHSAATAITMPSSAVPTGTGRRPRPRSSACRTPITALGGAPVPASARTSGAGAARRGGSPRCRRAWRTAGQADSATTTATVASAPATTTSGSMTT